MLGPLHHEPRALATEAFDNRRALGPRSGLQLLPNPDSDRTGLLDRITPKEDPSGSLRISSWDIPLSRWNSIWEELTAWYQLLREVPQLITTGVGRTTPSYLNY